MPFQRATEGAQWNIFRIVGGEDGKSLWWHGEANLRAQRRRPGVVEKWKNDWSFFGVRKKDAKILACTLSIHHTTRASNFSGIERETLTRSDARPPISHPNDALVGPKGTAHLENISNWLHSAIHLNLRQKNTILQVVNIRLRNQRHKWIHSDGSWPLYSKTDWNDWHFNVTLRSN